jgi:uncharacterized membrane protein
VARIRRAWLWASIFQFIGLRLLGFGLMAISVFVEGLPAVSLVILSMAIVFGFAYFYVFYYLLYKNQKPKVATFLLRMMPIMFISSVIKSVIDEGVWSIELMAGVLIDVVVFVWWYWMSWKLRKINRQNSLGKQEATATNFVTSQPPLPSG